MTDANKSNKEKDPIKAILDNNPCGICRSMGVPICKGHSGGGGGEASGHDEAKHKAEPVAHLLKTTFTPSIMTAIHTLNKAKTAWLESHLFSEKANDYDAGFLSIESDKLRGNFILKIQPELSQKEIEMARQFIKLIKTEFDEFIDDLKDRGVYANHFSAVLKNDSLSIHIPNPKYYNLFLQHLHNKNLLPAQNPEEHVKIEATNEPTHYEKKYSTPFDSLLKGPRPNRSTLKT